MFQHILLFGFLGVVFSSVDDAVVKRKMTEVEWNFFMLVSEWPQSACEYTNASSGHDCVIPPSVKSWVLHGLWPSNDDGGRQPYYCKHIKFDPDKVSDLMPQLEEYWPNLFKDTSVDSFWAHEYEKHGTCAASVHGFEDEHSYFQHALELHQKYNMMNVLSEQGIHPRSDPYDLSDIVDAVSSKFDVHVCVECSYVKSIGQLLSGAYVCLDKQLQLIDCNYCEHSCRSGEELYYHPLHFQ